MEPSREDHLAAIYKDFPHLPKNWVDMAYDVITKMDQGEVDEMKRKVEAKELLAKERDEVGEITSVEIKSPS